ncbi:MerR family transcriptional regulator [Nitrospirillum sp. BR 11163]|uniref:MerR family transcriptional regulator n=1 Tax=Nitrospirillum sp. BR 11163 TaxID=3104323 RepID=UPI002B0000A2|nr:MerR family transcriptional regulator [Nitrospirillum sp. BR 11163]MEA1677319.1 MerR family transcriptional regulator [Nitrospirillum sp. BR 11163]
MRIGELAERSGLSPSRLRFYESAGLIGPAERRANGYRAFPAETLTRLELITGAQRAGFTLEEIRGLLPGRDNNAIGHGPQIAEALRRKVGEIEALQQRLETSRTRLLAIIDSLENGPQDLGCVANTRRVLAEIKLTELKEAAAEEAAE